MPTNYERAFAERPEVYAAWGQLNGAIKAGMDLAATSSRRSPRRGGCGRATAASRTGRSSTSAFGEPVLEIALDHRAAGLDEVDVAVMDLAERVVDDATAIERRRPATAPRSRADSETEIMDVILAAAARCFFSKTLDALGVRPDASYGELEPELREALVVGRPIADA